MHNNIGVKDWHRSRGKDYNGNACISEDKAKMCLSFLEWF